MLGFRISVSLQFEAWGKRVLTTEKRIRAGENPASTQGKIEKAFSS
jgi:hypothetical protein